MSDVDGLRREIAEALALHSPLLLTGHVSCSCGWRSETSFHIELTTSRHREHVAHVVEVLVTAWAERMARERAGATGRGTARVAMPQLRSDDTGTHGGRRAAVTVTRWAQNVTIRPLSHERTPVGVPGTPRGSQTPHRGTETVVTTNPSAVQRPTGRHQQRVRSVSEQPYWFADWDEENAVGEYGWAPFLETREGHIPGIGVWFQTKAQCEDWIREYVVGAELVTE